MIYACYVLKLLSRPPSGPPEAHPCDDLCLGTVLAAKQTEGESLQGEKTSFMCQAAEPDLGTIEGEVISRTQRNLRRLEDSLSLVFETFLLTSRHDFGCGILR